MGNTPQGSQQRIDAEFWFGDVSELDGGVVGDTEISAEVQPAVSHTVSASQKMDIVNPMSSMASFFKAFEQMQHHQQTSHDSENSKTIPGKINFGVEKEEEKEEEKEKEKEKEKEILSTSHVKICSSEEKKLCNSVLEMAAKSLIKESGIIPDVDESVLRFASINWLRRKKHNVSLAVEGVRRYLLWHKTTLGHLKPQRIWGASYSMEPATLKFLSTGAMRLLPILPQGHGLMSFRLHLWNRKEYGQGVLLRAFHYLCRVALIRDPRTVQKGIVLVNDIAGSRESTLALIKLASRTKNKIPVRLAAIFFIKDDDETDMSHLQSFIVGKAGKKFRILKRKSELKDYGLYGDRITVDMGGTIEIPEDSPGLSSDFQAVGDWWLSPAQHHLWRARSSFDDAEDEIQV